MPQCRRLSAAFVLLSASVAAIGCDAVEDRYLVAEYEIAELASQPVTIVWFEGAELVDGRPVIDESRRARHVPLEDAGRLRELAQKNSIDFIGALEHAKGGGGTTSVLKRHAELSLDSAGRVTAHFVRGTSPNRWQRDAETGLPLASASGLSLKGKHSEWICVVPGPALKGVLWRRSLDAPEAWKQAGTVERVRVVAGGDIWRVKSAP